jgi:hypothetical protein
MLQWFRGAGLAGLAILTAGLPESAGAGPRLVSRNPALFDQDVSRFAERLLAVHNRHRAEVGAPPLAWSERLVATAAAYGPRLAASVELIHSPRSERLGISENLWMGPRGGYSLEAMVDYWAEEKRMFVPGLFPNVSSTGNWLDVSHYTTMIWRTTTEVGCALERSGRSDYLICHYSPKGNRDGKFVP